jgi:anti-sigma factor RsiW
MSDVVSEADLNAYIDDQLDTARRLAVEDYLTGNPRLAVRVIADLRARDTLRLLLRTPMRAAEGPTIEAAGRLKHRIVWRCIIDKLRKIAAIGFFVSIGWFTHEDGGVTHISKLEASKVAPTFVGDAIIAHRVEEMGRQIDTQSHHPTYDAAEIEAQINIRLPPLPADWAVDDVQIFPSDEGSSVEESISAASLGHISMFAVHTETDQVQPPAVASDGTETTIYWQAGHQAVALTGTGSGRPLRRMGWVLFGESVNSIN